MVFHGILHSTLAFATDTVDENLTQALCRAGYDVWLVDFRTSIAFGDDPQPLSFDQIARHAPLFHRRIAGPQHMTKIGEERGHGLTLTA